VAWTWRTARRLSNCCALRSSSTLPVRDLRVPSPIASHEIAAVLPCGQFSRRGPACRRITGMPQAFLAVTATALAALVPLAVAATRPP